MENESLKIRKLIQRLKAIVVFLEQRRTVRMHHNVNQFYYMQRIEELAALMEDFEHARARVDEIMELLDVKYFETFQRWRVDVLWIHRLQRAEINHDQCSGSC